MAASVWNMLVQRLGAGAGGIAGLHRPPGGRDDPLGDRRRAGREAEGVADGHHRVAHLHVVGVAEVTVGRLDALLICRRATSLVGSVSISVAGMALVLPDRVTVMVVAPEITWLLVTTSPLEVMIIPVPWSSWAPPPPPPPPKRPCEAGWGPLASMDTTAGSTLAITVSMLVVPLRSAGPAEISLHRGGRRCRVGGGHDAPADERADQGRATETTAHSQPGARRPAGGGSSVAGDGPTGPHTGTTVEEGGPAGGW